MHVFSKRCGQSDRATTPAGLRGGTSMLRRACGLGVGVLAVAAALAFPGPLRAGDGHGPVARPFKGWATGYITAQIPPNGLFLEMSGRATHLGNFTREEYAYLGADGSVTGTIVFTAANGDELWVEIDGAFTSATDVEGLYIITGGTGRFRCATGEATFKAYTPDFYYAEVTFKGTLSY
jgi:hypothetical protein